MRWQDSSVQSALPGQQALLAALFGSLTGACAELERGPVRIWGAEGIDAPLEYWLASLGLQRSADARQAIDLAAETLTNPVRLAELPDEAVVVCMVHPGHPEQSFDFYSTIHRHSLTVRLRLWGLPSNLTKIDGEVGEGNWLLLD